MKIENGGGGQRDKENKNFRDRIAKLNNIPPESVRQSEVFQLHHAYVTDAPFPYQLEAKYFDSQRTPRGRSEQEKTLSQLTEAWLDLTPQNISYGLFAPTYVEGLLQHKDTFPSETPHKALLVRASTKDAIKEYSAAVKTAYPDAECYVTDNEGDNTKTVEPPIARFVEGDPKNLPFPDKSVDSVHTNFLLESLTDKGQHPAIEKGKFYAEAHRVLRDNGILIMVEPTTNIKHEELAAGGFSHGGQDTAWAFSSRRDVERALTFGETNEVYPMNEIPEAAFVITTKHEITPED